MSNKWESISGWYAHEVGHGQVQFCKRLDFRPWFVTTQPATPHKQKNGKYDRFWLISKLKELRRNIQRAKLNPEGILGNTQPLGETWVSLQPTTGHVTINRSVIPQQGGFITRTDFDVCTNRTKDNDGYRIG